MTKQISQAGPKTKPNIRRISVIGIICYSFSYFATKNTTLSGGYPVVGFWGAANTIETEKTILFKSLKVSKSNDASIQNCLAKKTFFGLKIREIIFYCALLLFFSPRQRGVGPDSLARESAVDSCASSQKLQFKLPPPVSIASYIQPVQHTELNISFQS